MPKKEELFYDSRQDGRRIHAVKWIPDVEKPLFILQIIHGMAEYIDRYEEFAMFLANRGVLVIGQDHLGHGKSVDLELPQGYFCERDAITVMVRDVHRLKKMVQEEYQGVPIVLLGHSMGSFILRNYLFKYGTGIQAGVLIGTGKIGLCQHIFGKVVLGLQNFIYGSKCKSELVNKLTFGGYNKRITGPQSSMDWLCKERKQVDAYMADPLCGFTFTVNGFQTLLSLGRNAGKKENLLKMPIELPIFLLSGTEDPVGAYGKGVKAVCQSFLDAGMKHVQMKLYENDRHEILNESDREQIFEDIYQWIMSAI